MKKCSTCSMVYPDTQKYCPNCGKFFSNNKHVPTLYVPKPRIPKGSTISAILVLIITVLGAFAGYYYGETYAIQTTFYEYIENTYAFNTQLAVTIWIATAFSAVSAILC